MRKSCCHITGIGLTRDVKSTMLVIVNCKILTLGGEVDSPISNKVIVVRMIHGWTIVADGGYEKKRR